MSIFNNHYCIPMNVEYNFFIFSLGYVSLDIDDILDLLMSKLWIPSISKLQFLFLHSHVSQQLWSMIFYF